MNKMQSISICQKLFIGMGVFLLMLSLLNFLRQIIYIDNHAYEDFPIFYMAVQRYLENGLLYTRNIEHYYPASGIYKFPALYASFLLPLVKNNISLESAQTALMFLHVVLYISSIGMLIYLFMPTRNRVIFFLCASILAFNLYSLQETLRTLQLEMYILFFTTLILFLLTYRRHFFSGVFIAFISFLKVYPIFLILFFLWKRTAKFFLGFILASGLIVFVMISCFGLVENQWYFFNALPVMLQEGAFINYHNVGIEKLINHLFSTSQFIHYETPIGVGSAAITKIILWTCYLLAFWGFFRANNVLGSRSKYPHFMAFCLLLTLMIMTLKNPWSNYQIILVVPLIYTLSHFCVSLNKKFFATIFFITGALLCLAPADKSLFFSTFSEIASPLWMSLLALINNKLFACKGVATILVYFMLVFLLLSKKVPDYE